MQFNQSMASVWMKYAKMALLGVIDFFANLVVMLMFHWILLLPLLVYALGFYWRLLCDTRNYKSMIRWLFSRFTAPERAWRGSDRINVSIAFMSGRVLNIEASTLWSIRDLKIEVCQLEGVPLFQLRMFAGGDEIHDEVFLSESKNMQYTVVLRSLECGKWLEQLSAGNACSLKDASDEIRASKECVLAAVRRNTWQSLKYSPEYHDDEEVAMAAVRTDGLALVAVSSRLRTKPEVALAAIGRDRESMCAVPEPLRSDREFLRRSYWVSTLDCRKNQRLKQEELGSFESWEDVLYKHNGSLRRVPWKYIHEELRKDNLPSNLVGSYLPFCVPFLMHVYAGDSKLPYWHAFVAMSFPTVVSICAIRPVFHEMHVEFVKWVAGPLEDLRKSCC